MAKQTREGICILHNSLYNQQECPIKNKEGAAFELGGMASKSLLTCHRQVAMLQCSAGKISPGQECLCSRAKPGGWIEEEIEGREKEDSTGERD